MIDEQNPCKSTVAPAVVGYVERKPSVAFLLLPTICGAVLGGVVLARYFARGVGDPDGHSIGAGIGAIVFLTVAMFVRNLRYGQH